MNPTTATTTRSSYPRVWMITGASRGIGAVGLQGQGLAAACRNVRHQRLGR